MNSERLEKIQSFISNLQAVYDEYKRDPVIPETGNITIILTSDQVQALKDLFVDGMQKAIFSNEKDHYLKYNALYENIFFQVAAELFI